MGEVKPPSGVKRFCAHVDWFLRGEQGETPDPVTRILEGFYESLETLRLTHLIQVDLGNFE